MKILIINGDYLLRNSSANLCHLAYIKGFLDANHQITLISADGKGYQRDESMVIPKNVKNITFYGVSLYEKLSLKKEKKHLRNNEVSNSIDCNNKNMINEIISHMKKFVLSLYGVHGIYAKVVKVAKKYKSDEFFDYCISISTPAASHLLAYKLIKSNHIHAKHWIQIWEDPWYSDIYGFHKKNKIYKEEKRLLSFAEKVCYVSPITLKNQQRLFPESAEKMYWQPLPFYYQGENIDYSDFENNVYGYFGDYVPAARNLKCFYEAAKEMNISVNICGNPNNLFHSTDKINIYPRMSLNDLKEIEDKTNVLIFLCNKNGGQIPGKIYQYSATNKIILFILDGTEEEKSILKDYFAKYNRYVFCENNIDDIKRAISLIENKKLSEVNHEPVLDFNPKDIITNILNME